MENSEAYTTFVCAIVLRIVAHYSINQNFNYAKNNDVIIIQMLHGSSRFCRSEYTDDSPRIGTDPTRGGGNVSGVVTDEHGPVIGAAVTIKNSPNGVTTGMDGDFTLSNLKPNDVIVVSFLGYKTQEIPYTGQTHLDIKLTASAVSVDEVVVTALGIKRQEKALSYNVQ